MACVVLTSAKALEIEYVMPNCMPEEIVVVSRGRILMHQNRKGTLPRMSRNYSRLHKRREAPNVVTWSRTAVSSVNYLTRLEVPFEFQSGRCSETQFDKYSSLEMHVVYSSMLYKVINY
jgi:hypothetical protein